MNKRLTKPHELNPRLETPTGLIGVPPRTASGRDDTYIIVTDRETAESFINNFFPKNKIWGSH